MKLKPLYVFILNRKGSSYVYFIRTEKKLTVQMCLEALCLRPGEDDTCEIVPVNEGHDDSVTHI